MERGEIPGSGSPAAGPRMGAAQCGSGARLRGWVRSRSRWRVRLGSPGGGESTALPGEAAPWAPLGFPAGRWHRSPSLPYPRQLGASVPPRAQGSPAPGAPEHRLCLENPQGAMPGRHCRSPLVAEKKSKESSMGEYMEYNEVSLRNVLRCTHKDTLALGSEHGKDMGRHKSEAGCNIQGSVI